MAAKDQHQDRGSRPRKGAVTAAKTGDVFPLAFHRPVAEEFQRDDATVDDESPSYVITPDSPSPRGRPSGAAKASRRDSPTAADVVNQWLFTSGKSDMFVERSARRWKRKKSAADALLDTGLADGGTVSESQVGQWMAGPNVFSAVTLDDAESR